MRQNLIQARKDRDLTQAQLGKMLGLSKQSISGIERGWINSTPQVWETLEDILKVPQRQLRELVQPNCTTNANSGIKAD